MIAVAALSFLLAQATASPQLSPSLAPSATPAPSPAAKPVLVRAASGAVAIPTTWQAAPSTVTATQQGVLGAWMGESGETIVLYTLPRNGLSLDTMVKRLQTKIGQTRLGATFKSSTAQTFCHGANGRKLVFTDGTGNGDTVMIALSRGRVYFLSYQYPGYPGTSSEGETAAESLCPPPDPAVRMPPPPISVPAGWVLQDPTSFGLPEGTSEWVWLPPVGATQGLEVNAVPHGALYSLGAYGSTVLILHSTDRASVQRAFMALRVVSTEAKRICDKFDGSERRLTMMTKNGSVQLDWISAVTDSAMYNAIYLHYATTAADPHAEAAIRSLCPRR